MELGDEYPTFEEKNLIGPEKNRLIPIPLVELLHTYLFKKLTYGQVYDVLKNPWNEELYGFDEISKEKSHSECARELFAKYQRLALRNQYTKVDHHVWVNHFFKGEIERQAPQPNRAKKKGMSETAYFHSTTSPAA